MYRYKQVFLVGFLVWDRVLGWWLKSRGGGGALVWRHPFSNYLGYTSNGHLC